MSDVTHQPVIANAADKFSELAIKAMQEAGFVHDPEEQLEFNGRAIVIPFKKKGYIGRCPAWVMASARELRMNSEQGHLANLVKARVNNAIMTYNNNVEDDAKKICLA